MKGKDQNLWVLGLAKEDGALSQRNASKGLHSQSHSMCMEGREGLRWKKIDRHDHSSHSSPLVCAYVQHSATIFPVPRIAQTKLGHMGGKIQIPLTGWR
jgi:hypothetical protein